ncbi:DNA cross-link repair 1 protein-like isoform X2 [Eurosta solidaginis]|uniref:DNA cross-link repair 1 protein-like isoform X2 n=1 Tax=Eurosta solidaginis TaxID=178769 RepID=UPI0035315EF1
MSTSQANSTSSKAQGSHRSGTSLQKFSSIVNKVESLINKMNNDKFNNFKLLQSNSLFPGRNPAIQKQELDDASVVQACSQCVGEQDQQGLPSLNDTLTRTASLDSLNQQTDTEDTFDNQDFAYTDSDDAEIAHITGTTAVQVHRRCDLDQLTDETIREFNEQCSSLSHDADFDNAWSAEEEDYKCWAAASAEVACSCDNERREKAAKETTFRKIFKNDIYKSNSNNNINNKNYKNYNNIKIGDYAVYQRDKNNNNKLNVTQNNIHETAWSPTLTTQQHGQESEYESSQQNSTTETTSSTCDEMSDIREKELKTENGYKNAQIIHTNTNNNNDSQIDGTVFGIINLQQSLNKPRRTSIASSGSVGRMETILEEPSESKVSVREILARFETMSMTETFQNSTEEPKSWTYLFYK